MPCWQCAHCCFLCSSLWGADWNWAHSFALSSVCWWCAVQANPQLAHVLNDPATIQVLEPGQQPGVPHILCLETSNSGRACQQGHQEARPWHFSCASGLAGRCSLGSAHTQPLPCGSPSLSLLLSCLLPTHSQSGAIVPGLWCVAGDGARDAEPGACLTKLLVGSGGAAAMQCSCEGRQSGTAVQGVQVVSHVHQQSLGIQCPTQYPCIAVYRADQLVVRARHRADGRGGLLWWRANGQQGGPPSRPIPTSLPCAWPHPTDASVACVPWSRA